MGLFVGLDVSARSTSVWVMDGTGQVVNEAKVHSEPSSITSLLGKTEGRYRRVGLEAGALSQWLYGGLAAAGFPATCVETRHMNAALSAQIN